MTAFTAGNCYFTSTFGNTQVSPAAWTVIETVVFSLFHSGFEISDLSFITGILRSPFRQVLGEYPEIHIHDQSPQDQDENDLGYAFQQHRNDEYDAYYPKERLAQTVYSVSFQEVTVQVSSYFIQYTLSIDYIYEL